MDSRNIRSKNYITQVKGSVFFKLLAVLASFIAMPFMIKYLGVERFGVWSTMLTLVTWATLFDLGIGNGLKNNVSQSLAIDNEKEAAGYISTSYVSIGILSVVLFAIVCSVWFYTPWGRVFNTDSIPLKELSFSVLLLSAFVFSNFWLDLINQIIHGLQRSALVVVGQFFSNLLSLLMVLYLYNFHNASIIDMVFVYGIAIVIPNMILSIYVFCSEKGLRPKVKAFDRKKLIPLLSLGLKFFIIQIAVIVIFLTDKIIITQLVGPEEVTSYDVIFKIFSIFTIIHGLIIAPLWPAYSNAYAKRDFEWIESVIKQQLVIAGIIVSCALLMSFIGPYIVDVWIDAELDIEESIFFFFLAFIAVSVWNNVFAYFVNAINKIRLQVYTSVIAAIVNIPMSIFFVKYIGLGLSGVVLATTLSLSIFGLVAPFQVYGIVKKRL